jgi:maltose-binding protein MalE
MLKCSAGWFVRVFVVLLWLGCGGGGEEGASDEPIEIVIWEQKDPEEQVFMNKHLDAFMASHPNVRISTSHFETDLLQTQFQTAGLAGGGPDLVYGPSDKIGPYSVMQLIRPLEDMFPREFFDNFAGGSVPSLDGHIYAVPDQLGNHLMLLYNKALVEKLPEDSDEWIAMCKELTVDKDGDGFPDQYGLVFNFNEPFWLAPFLNGFGGWVMDEQFRPTLDTPAMRGTLAFLASLRNKHKIIPRESNYEVSDTMFKMGQAAFIINGPWSLKAYLKAGIDMGVMPLPLIRETGFYPAPMVSSRGYSISANVNEDKLPVVKELFIYLTSVEVQREIMKELSILPSLKELADDPLMEQNEILKGSMEQAKLGRPMPVVPEMRAIWDAIRPFYQSVLGGEMTPDEAATKMQEKAVKSIKEMKG